MKGHREESPRLHREVKGHSEESHVLRVRACLVEYSMDKNVAGRALCPSQKERQYLAFALKQRVTEEQASVAHKRLSVKDYRE